MTAADRLRALAEAATPGPWVRGWWTAQVESMCECDRKGRLIGKRPQNDYPGAGPYHIHESDFYEDEHQISGLAPSCEEVAGNYGYEEGGIIKSADAAYIAALHPAVTLAIADLIDAAADLRSGYVTDHTSPEWAALLTAFAHLEELLP